MQRRFVHRGHEKSVVRTESDGEMRARPLQHFRLCGHVGKPEAHAVVMGDRKAKALWRERQPADRRWRVERFLLALAAANERSLAGGPRHRALRMQCDVVDPAPLRIGRNQLHLAAAVERHQPAVVAAHDEALTIRGRAQNSAAVNGTRRDFGPRVHQVHVLLGADKGRALAEKLH